MATRIVRVHESDVRALRGVRRIVDPAATGLMIAISGTVLAATLVVAGLSTGGGPRSLMAAASPAPAPPPVLATGLPRRIQ